MTSPTDISPKDHEDLFTNAEPFGGATASGPVAENDTDGTDLPSVRGAAVARELEDGRHNKNPQAPTARSDEGQHTNTVNDQADDGSAPDARPAVIATFQDAAHRLYLDRVYASGVIRFFNPTYFRMRVHFPEDERSHNNASINGTNNSSGSNGTSSRHSDDMDFFWRSRDERKGRRSIVVPVPSASSDQTLPVPVRYTPRLKSSPKSIATVFWKMLTTFPYWDMSFWSGWSYTIGSALFVLSGIFAFGPVAYPNWPLSADCANYGSPLCFFIGALFYQTGAVAGYLEAVNDGSFHGAAMRRLLDGHDDDSKKLLDEKIGQFLAGLKPLHSHRQQQAEEREEAQASRIDPEAGWNAKDRSHSRLGSLAFLHGKLPAPRRGGVDLGGQDAAGAKVNPYTTWRWWPTWQALRTYHIHEIGYVALTIQLFGVTCYTVTGVLLLPGVFSSLTFAGQLAYWVIQIVAAACFLVASIMFMLETQQKWYKLEPGILGWWIGAWATLGSVGFELIAIFGTLSLVVEADAHWALYQADLATIWGSAGYLMSSFLQWYEALNKDPVEEMLREPGEMRSHQVHPI